MFGKGEILIQKLKNCEPKFLNLLKSKSFKAISNFFIVQQVIQVKYKLELKFIAFTAKIL